MERNSTQCPDRQQLKQFVLGQLSLTEVENFEYHLSNCDPCIETVNGLQISDTFTDVTRQAWPAIEAAEDQSGSDDQLIERMIHDAEGWSVATRPVRNSEPLAVTAGKSAEVQNLLREPQEPGDLGAVAHFRLVELLGAGSTGVVYRGIDTKLDRDVVIKILRSSLGEAARQRFVTEAKSTAAIDHANVVTIYEVGSDGPLSYIAMQWIPGQTLEQCLAECDSLTLEQTKKLAIEIASGLAAAHQIGLIHRDIKPANIWIPENDGPAKILDFGLVRVNEEDPQLTCTGMIAGTPCFMSPEQSRGDSLDARSDLFSLGCLIYQCLTGKLPFRGDNALATLRSIQQVHPTHPKELDPAIDSDMSDLTMCLLAKSPARRPDSAQTLVASLQTESNQWPFELVSESNVKSSQAASQGTRSSFWKIVAAMLIGVGVTSLCFAYGQQIIRIATNQGEIVIDAAVDDVKIEVSKAGELVRVIDLATENTIEITAGEYQLRPVGDENTISIDKNSLTLSRGEKEIVKITRTESSTTDNARRHEQGIQSAILSQRGGRTAKSEKSNTTELAATDDQKNNKRESVYKENTYTQWLQIARNDRDAGVLIDACKGIANLASEDQNPEMLEAIVQIARRGPGLCSREEASAFNDVVRRIFDRQTTETKLKMLAQELRAGTRMSRRYFIRSIHGSGGINYSYNQNQLAQYSNVVADLLSAINDSRIVGSEFQVWELAWIVNWVVFQKVIHYGRTFDPPTENDRRSFAARIKVWKLEENEDLKQILDDFMEEFALNSKNGSWDWIARYFASENVLLKYSEFLEDTADNIEALSLENPKFEHWPEGLRIAREFCATIPESKRPLKNYIEFCKRVFQMDIPVKEWLVEPLGIVGVDLSDGLLQLRNGEPVVVSSIAGDSLQGELEFCTGRILKFNSIGFQHPKFYEEMISSLGRRRDLSQFEIERNTESGQFTVVQHFPPSDGREKSKSQPSSNSMKSAFRRMDRALTNLIKDEKKNKSDDVLDNASQLQLKQK